jgi:glucokinase
MINSPSIIVLAGGLARAGDLIFKKTKEYFEKHLIKTYKNQIDIVPSALMDQNPAVLGAAALAWNELNH